MLRLRIKAPFGAFRTFTAGTFRPTAPFLTPSAAYGLLLNIAGIESRFDDGKSLMTLMGLDLPAAEIALGAVRFPYVNSIYQQLHNYRVGENEKIADPQSPGSKIARKEEGLRRCKGAKYNIHPVRREFLSDLDAYICLRGNDALESRVRQGLGDGSRRKVAGQPCYGIPFLGDNSFMVDVLREESPPESPAHWYRKLGREATDPAIPRCRLTVWIDRADTTRTVSHLYAPTAQPQLDPPDDAWTPIAPPSRPGP